MPNGPVRRQLLKAVAASSFVAPIAGCLDTLESGSDDGTAASGDTGPSSNEADADQAACTVGEALIAALGDGDFETAASSYPYSHFEDGDKDEDEDALDEADIAADLENGDVAQLEWVDTDIEDISCECVEPYSDDARTELDEDVVGDVTTVVELRFSIAYDDGTETGTESAFVNGVEIDGEWYGMISQWGSRDLCADGEVPDEHEDDSASDDHSAREQALEPTDWEDVDEIVLDGEIASWVGVEPAPIEDIENPTLLLFEGREYTIEWRNADGMPHNLKIRDEADDGLAETELIEGEGESASLTVDATAAMDNYVCEPHAQTMVGDIDVRDKN
ncbi:hypothetical protein GS429_17080 [Natronorubrum sp. JWXQ-INN-674]|uniref:Blue (type 1) copper domain-containing protein n=1 Tax=Natronorubrum halalkaliphilum TaxID=2691917 RepID=A0A6B0VSI8_9EURY|nr:plastocyanin/azurin family copper-binding protein [Natronorubrum halalkaliphilum]MXV63742.1 hypothetical protein [Natronorubrum halalkaliphilum]